MLYKARLRLQKARAKRQTVLAWNMASAVVALLGAGLSGRSVSYEELFPEKREIGAEGLAALLLSSLGGTVEGAPGVPSAESTKGR